MTGSSAAAAAAAVTWARVSAEVDARLCESAGRPVGLRPDEWVSGDICWLIHMVGDARGLTVGLQALLEGPYKNRDVHVVAPGADGAPRAQKLSEFATRHAPPNTEAAP